MQMAGLLYLLMGFFILLFLHELYLLQLLFQFNLSPTNFPMEFTMAIHLLPMAKNFKNQLHSNFTIAMQILTRLMPEAFQWLISHQTRLGKFLKTLHWIPSIKLFLFPLIIL